jgi:hypothetical protein
MLSDYELAGLGQVLIDLVDAVDAELVDAIRRNTGQMGSREALLCQLDLIDKVREQLHGRLERADLSIRRQRV